MVQTAVPTVETIADTALIIRQVTFTAAATITIGTLILCDATGGAFTVTLPLAGAQAGVSRILIVKKIDSSANAVTVSRAGSDTMDGSTTKSLAAQYETLELADDDAGSLWHILKDAGAP